jgi:hypothetical protein
MESDWLKEAGRLLLTGYVYSGWMVKKAILALVERDEEGHYFISNETLGLYAVGITQEEALEDFKATLVDNYQYLEAKVDEDPDFANLFLEYQKYLKRPAPLAV